MKCTRTGKARCMREPINTCAGTPSPYLVSPHTDKRFSGMPRPHAAPAQVRLLSRHLRTALMHAHCGCPACTVSLTCPLEACMNVN